MHADERMTSVDAAAALGLQGKSRLKQQVGTMWLPALHVVRLSDCMLMWLVQGQEHVTYLQIIWLHKTVSPNSVGLCWLLRHWWPAYLDLPLQQGH